jgi:RNA polymerase sigma-70 factor (ECF subfamily)
VARCRRGDHAAWRALYDRYAPTVHRFLSALGVPPSEREDACQDVFVAVYRSLARFRGEARLSTWIYRIAARGAGRAVQRRRLQALISTLLLREPPPAPTADPSERTARLQLLDDMIGRLTPKKRLVLVLFEIEELPVDEIAKIAGCPENTVWSRLHHARAELTEMAKRRAG